MNTKKTLKEGNLPYFMNKQTKKSYTFYTFLKNTFFNVKLVTVLISGSERRGKGENSQANKDFFFPSLLLKILKNAFLLSTVRDFQTKLLMNFVSSFKYLQYL